MDLAIGTEFAGHRIERIIGRGGASVVYLAQHLRLGRKVALKVLAPHLVEDDSFRERFIRESRIAGGLDHPNIVAIYDAGEVEGILYISMRYVSGQDLGQLLRVLGTLEPSRAILILSQVAGALDAAHLQGLVHRDVKPGNILIESTETTFDRAYLSDFGISKRATTGTGLTRTGHFVGTVDYVAPEQITGGPVDGRTDVYSLGCVLYQCISGRVPFSGQIEVATIYSQLHDAPPSLEGFGQSAEGLDRVLVRALAKVKEERYVTCSELVEAARTQLESAPFPTTIAGPASAMAISVPKVALESKSKPGLGAAHSPQEVRTTVTVVFCDVTDSTALSQRLDPEALRSLMSRFFERMKAVLEAHGGTVEKFIGDAVMAVFGVPRVHEDDALRAVRAAADMRSALEVLNTELERDHGVTLACRIGVNTGAVVAGAGNQMIVTGNPVNVAARLEQAASSGEILLGEVTFSLVRNAVVAQPIKALQVRGMTDPVPAFRLMEVTPGAAGFARHLDAPMVGRERELALLRNAFERTLSDHACQLFTILGDAGVGKSRLVAAFVETLGDRAMILRGRCLPYGEGITFYPLAEALIEVAELDEADTPEAVQSKLAALLGDDERADAIADRVGQAIGLLGSETAPEETLWAIRVTLERLAEERSLLFAIDDLQWAEPKFLDLVEYIADLARDAPILLACMARPEFLDDHPGWSGGKLNATSIMLEPLNPEECGTLVANLLSDDTVDEGVRMKIAGAAEGNPLYAEEITGLLVDQGRLVLKDGRWKAAGDLTHVPVPPTISALLAARLGNLPHTERQLIEIASVMGQVFNPGALRALADEEPDQIGYGINALVRKQFVRPEHSDLPATEAMEFRHLLIRDAAYGAIPKATRADLHERFADWYEGAGTVGERDEILGYHLEQACRYRQELGLPSERERAMAIRACQHLSSAARRATARIDIPAAASLFGRAASLLDQEDAGYPELLWELGATLNRLGDEENGDGVLSKAIDLASSRGDTHLEDRARLDRWFSRIPTDPTGIREQMPREVGLLIPGLEDRGDDLGLTKAWQLISEAHWIAGQFGAMNEPLQRALIHARRANDRLEESEVLVSLLQACVGGPMPIDVGFRRCEEILRDVKDDRRVEAEVSAAMGVFHAMGGNFDEARGLVVRGGEILRDLGLTYWAYEASGARWDVEMLAGDAASAELAVRVPYEALPSSEVSQERSGFATRLAYALCAQGRYEEALRFVDISKESGDAFVWDQVLWRCASAKALAQLGDLERALGLAREAITMSETTDAFNLRGDALVDFAEVVSMTGEVEEANVAIEAAIALYERKGNLASAARARSVLE